MAGIGLGEVLVGFLAPFVQPGRIGMHLKPLLGRDELEYPQPPLPSVREKLVVG